MKTIETALKNQVNNLILNSLFKTGGTTTEREAEKRAFKIVRDTIYFLSYGKVNKIKINKHGFFCLGYGFEYGDRWRWQHTHGRQRANIRRLLTHVLSKSDPNKTERENQYFKTELKREYLRELKR